MTSTARTCELLISEEMTTDSFECFYYIIVRMVTQALIKRVVVGRRLRGFAGQTIFGDARQGRTDKMGKFSTISERFGILLWHILGGREASQRVAAERLGVHVCFLNAVLHGGQRVSQRFLANKRWRDVLAKYYPAGWKQHSAAFERCAASLRVSRGYCSIKPRKKGGFGYVLWLILGGEGMDLMKASEQLNIDQTYLSAIIHGRMRTSQQTVNKREWRRVFMEHYAEGWRQHADEFEKYAAAMAVRAGRPKTSA